MKVTKFFCTLLASLFLSSMTFADVTFNVKGALALNLDKGIANIIESTDGPPRSFFVDNIAVDGKLEDCLVGEYILVNSSAFDHDKYTLLGATCSLTFEANVQEIERTNFCGQIITPMYNAVIDQRIDARNTCVVGLLFRLGYAFMN